MSTERDAAAVFEALSSDTAREMLVAATHDPRSAEAFADHCDVSLPTVYRHVDTLVERGMLDERLELDGDGNHYTVYVATLDFVRFDLEETGFAATVRRRMDVVERFGRLWTDLEPATD